MPVSLLTLPGAAALGVLLLLGGCGGEGSSKSAATTVPISTAADRLPPPPRSLEAPPCPADAPNCVRASGVVLYVERVDPDGDGDAHAVLASAEGITAPGISVIDIEAELRPDPLPAPGDQLAAAGPVYSGSYGQDQIETVAIRIRRDGGREGTDP